MKLNNDPLFNPDALLVAALLAMGFTLYLMIGAVCEVIDETWYLRNRVNALETERRENSH